MIDTYAEFFEWWYSNQWGNKFMPWVFGVPVAAALCVGLWALVLYCAGAYPENPRKFHAWIDHAFMVWLVGTVLGIFIMLTGPLIPFMLILAVCGFGCYYTRRQSLRWRTVCKTKHDVPSK